MNVNIYFNRDVTLVFIEIEAQNRLQYCELEKQRWLPTKVENDCRVENCNLSNKLVKPTNSNSKWKLLSHKTKIYFPLFCVFVFNFALDFYNLQKTTCACLTSFMIVLMNMHTHLIAHQTRAHFRRKSWLILICRCQCRHAGFVVRRGRVMHMMHLRTWRERVLSIFHVIIVCSSIFGCDMTFPITLSTYFKPGDVRKYILIGDDYYFGKFVGNNWIFR